MRAEARRPPPMPKAAPHLQAEHAGAAPSRRSKHSHRKYSLLSTFFPTAHRSRRRGHHPKRSRRPPRTRTARLSPGLCRRQRRRRPRKPATQIFDPRRLLPPRPASNRCRTTIAAPRVRRPSDHTSGRRHYLPGATAPASRLRHMTATGGFRTRFWRRGPPPPRQGPAAAAAWGRSRGGPPAARVCP